MKRAGVPLCILFLALAAWPVPVRGQYLLWHYDKLIENNAGYDQDVPQIALSGSKAVAVWHQYDGVAHHVYVNNSTTGGATWRSARRLEMTGANMSRWPRAAISGSLAVAAWIEADTATGWRVWAGRSTDGGTTWKDYQMIQPASGGDVSLAQPIVCLSGTRVLVAWLQSDSGNRRVYANMSADGGLTWGTAKRIDASGLQSVRDFHIALSGTRAVLLLTRNDGSNDHAMANHSLDGGLTWNSEQALGQYAGEDAYDLHVAVSGTNAVAVWAEDTLSGRNVCANYSTDGGQVWHASLSIKDPAICYANPLPRLALSGNRAVVVWRQELSGGGNPLVWSNSSTDGGANWQGPHVVESDTGYVPAALDLSLSGASAVAIWRRPALSGEHVFACFSKTGGGTWESVRKINGVTGTVPSSSIPHVAISGTKVAAVWQASDGVSFRIVSNSATQTMVQKYLLLPPVLVSPANGLTGVPLSVTLQWQDTNFNPQEIKYRIRIKPVGGAYTLITLPANSLTYIKSGLKPGKTYQWNIMAVGNGTTILSSTWANGGVDWRFTIQP